MSHRTASFRNKNRLSSQLGGANIITSVPAEQEPPSLRSQVVFDSGLATQLRTDLEDGPEHGRVIHSGAVPAAVPELVLALGDAGPRTATHAAHMVLPAGQVRSCQVRSGR